MKLFISSLILSTIVSICSAEMYANETLIKSAASCSYSATCSVSGVSGVCVSISAGCCNGGTTTSNLCPGSTDIKCCTKPSCSTPSGSGKCEQTTLCSSQGGKSVPGYCTGPSDIQCCVSGGGGGLSRDVIISRAQSWVDAKVAYDSYSTYGGYRCDCSGYVSMAWELPQPGPVTQDFPSYCTKITKGELQKGDALLKPSQHVLLFDYWVDSDQFVEYAEHGTGQVASKDTTSYSYYSSNGYYPCRFNNVASA